MAPPMALAVSTGLWLMLGAGHTGLFPTAARSQRDVSYLLLGHLFGFR